MDKQKNVRESLLLAILQVLGFRDAFEIDSKSDYQDHYS